MSKTTCKGACLLPKSLSLRSFHTCQEISKMIEAMALRLGVDPTAIMFHHSMIVRHVHCRGSSSGIRIQSLMKPHRQTVKRQWMKRWSMDSVHCLHRGKKLTIRPTTLQQMVRRSKSIWFEATQKKLTLGGAHVIHFGCQG
jgi:hypothetical protein